MLKAGAIILSRGRLLVVHKREIGDNPIFIIPGGKIENRETALDALRRELDEELGINLSSAKFFGRFTSPAAFEEAQVIVESYVVRISGIPKPRGEINRIAWIDRNYRLAGYELGSILEQFVVPRLIKRHLM